MDSSNGETKQPPPQPISTTTDLYQICRLCLNTLQADEGESVFNNQVPSLPEKIYRVFGVQITDAKDLPNKLCSKCVQNTEQCYSHRETYKRQERVLHDLLKKPAAEEVKNSPKSEYVYSPADSNHSSSSGLGSDARYVKAQNSANNINNVTTSPPYETNASLASHVEVIQGCDEMAAEVTIAHDSEETVSGDDTICTDNNAEYGTYNDDENIIVVKTEPDDEYDEEYKNDDGSEGYDQQSGPKVIASVQFPIVNGTIVNGTHKIGQKQFSLVNCIPTSWASGTSKDRRKQSCPTRALELSGFRTQVAGDDTNSSDEGNGPNWTTKKIRSNSPAVIVKPAYAWPNLQGSGQTLIFQTKNPDGTTSELRPQVMQVGEWANNQGQSNAPTDPSDRMGMLLFAATHIQELSTESDDGQSPGTPKGATVVRGKLVSSDQKRKIYQTQATIRRYSDGHQVQQQVKDINASPNVPRKRTARESSVQRMCSNCGTTCSTIWRRLNEDPVCNACGLYYKLHGKIRPPTMRRDTIHTRQRRKRSDNAH
ncbi:uncharacterized protein LOC126832803 isoform X2 [Adelges cooleyi]|uniref:uncharacterized protein LOC126832803 isoform X2 n=1 Tax=Adelges cooleyi TaxID=133065 RepID=UPI002180103A|nr:uncharacterized protein LOC126832803 isoform X2 [Adelges cooleyi]XP_050419718.1 uncharacterized protein LOC126832803 isoform X2 [Adelges cooleyi]